ncbi:MAG: HAMP domain-containing histidine kinase [Halobacteriovoraceae bacterium]|nr:HAMP domain-containing histidine kinase [Halobacteriovoraceae bacterium]
MKKKFLLVITILTTICILLILCLYFEAKILSGIRAYVRGEGLYSKGQKDAVIALTKYVRTKKEEDFRDFEEMISIPIGDRIAREALLEDEPNKALAYKGFLQAQNSKEDIPTMINLFVYFQKLPFIANAIQIWTEGDKKIKQLHEAGNNLKNAVQKNEQILIDKYMLEINVLNSKLAALELDFSLTLSEGANGISQSMIRLSYFFFFMVFILVFFYIKNIVKSVDRLEKYLKDKQLKLKNEVEIKNRFFSIIAHDLNSPYNQLMGLTEVMTSEADEFSKEEIVELAKNVYESASRVFNLQNDLLKWSRTQFEKGEVSRKKITTTELFKDSIHIYKTIAEDKNISLLNHIQEELVLVDPDMIQTVLRNLISNAIKFTPKEGKIVLSSELKGNHVEIKVTDSGVGISKKQQEDLFRPDKLSSNFGTNGERGTGIGLILCKEMLQKNDGDINVESNEGNGTQVIFTIPLCKE